jgi:hypothetical protein
MDLLIGSVLFFSFGEDIAAKQAAFEEQNKLKNQFRALDDDEIEFLDEVRAREKAEEERARREIEEGLKAFRERQKSTGSGGAGGGSGGDGSLTASEDMGGGGGGGEEAEEWVVGGRKRKRHHEREVLGVKKKVAVGAEGKDGVKRGGHGDGPEKKEVESGGSKKEGKIEGGGDESEKRGGPPKEEKKPSLGLVSYGSDSDEDED